MIVNESFARRFFDGRDPVGRRVQIYGKPFRIVGMVKDSKYYSLSEAPQPYFYMSFDQVHNGSGENGVALYARTDGDARGFVPVLRREMSAIDPNSAGLTAMPLSDYISAAWFGPRIASLFLGVLGAISMLLAGVGLYGVMAYSVSQRTREIGIRMALGADREGVLRMVMRARLVAGFVGDCRRARHRAGGDPADRASAVPSQSGGPGKHSGSSAVPYCGCGTRKPDSSAASHEG